MQGNIAAGSERAGFYTAGVPCSEAEAAGGAARWSGNVAHSSLFGMQVKPLVNTWCTAITGLDAFRIFNHAVYSENHINYELRLYDISIADAKYGFWLQQTGCDSIKHVRCDKYARRFAQHFSPMERGVCTVISPRWLGFSSSRSALPTA